MTNPTHPPAPIQLPAMPRFCSRCEIHMSTTHQPLCPVCVDEIKRAAS